LFDGLFRDEELICNITVPITACDLLQDFGLALSELFVAEVLGQICGDIWGELLFAGVDLPDDFHNFLWRHALEEVSASSGVKSATDLYISGKGSQYDDSSFRKFRANGDQCVDAAHVGKPQIQKSDVGRALTESLNRLGAIGSLRGEEHVLLA